MVGEPVVGVDRTTLIEEFKLLKSNSTHIVKSIGVEVQKNLIEHFNKPNPPQEELLEAFLDDEYKVFTYTGGNRSGKTTIGVILSLSVMFGKFLWNGTRLNSTHSGSRKVRIVGQDWEKHIKAVVIPALNKWWPRSREVHKKKNNTGVEAFWTDVKTGSTLEILSNLSDSEVAEGWEGDLIYYDEPPKRNMRIACARGLVDREGRELFMMTLLKEAWVAREVIKARNADGTPDRTIFNVHATIYDNLGFGISSKGVDQFAKTLDEDEKAARLMGVPSYMTGLVLPEFKRKVHLKPRFEIPLDAIIDIAIDCHPRTPQAILFMATIKNGYRYLIKEIWNNGDGTWIGEQIVRAIDKYKFRVGSIIIDPLAKGDANNDNTLFDKVDHVLYTHGYALDTATKDKDSGITDIRSHLKGPNNEASLFVFDDLVHVTREMEDWMYDKDTNKPQKKNDHFCENLYRLLLLDTQWYPLDAYDYDPDDAVNQNTTACKTTGY